MPDIEGALRTWLRAQPAVTAIVGQRVFFGVPKAATEASFPMLTVQLVAGADEESDAPVDRSTVQVDVWGSLDESGNGRKAECTALMNAVRAAFRDVRGRTPLTAAVAAFGLNVVGRLWLPDQDNDRPRYVLSVEVTSIAT